MIKMLKTKLYDIKLTEQNEKIAREKAGIIKDTSPVLFGGEDEAAYAVISYQTAYLKTYFPVEFLAALLTSSFACFFVRL